MTEGSQDMKLEKKEMTIEEPGRIRGLHITPGLFCNWQAGRMGQNEEEKFLEHIGTCTFCAQQFGDWMERGITEPETSAGLIQSPEDARRPPLLSEPPAYLREEILRRSRQIDVQAGMRIKETSHRIQLLMYSLKVGAAVMASIFLLMVTSNVRNMEFDAQQIQKEQRGKVESVSKEPGITDTLKQKSGEVSSFLNSLSNGLFRVETEETKQEEIRR